MTVKQLNTPSRLTMKIIKTINDRMSELGISRGTLARETGVGRGYLYKVLDGENMPTLAWIERVCAYLDLEINCGPRHGRRRSA